MIYHELSNNEIRVSAIGFGCSKLGSIGSGLGVRQGVNLVAEALGHGINFFDTSNIYGQGDSERILGRVFQGQRDRAVVLTKAGYDFRHIGPVLRFIKPVARRASNAFRAARRMSDHARSGALRQCFDKDYIVRSLEDSLKRFRTDYVDIFLLHSAPVSVFANEELFEQLDALKRQGKIRCYGFSMIQLSSNIAEDIPYGVSMVGTAVNPASASNIAQLDSLASNNIGVLAYQPFGSGALLNGEREMPLDESVNSSTLKSNKTLAQELILFALEKTGVKSVVVGFSSSEHLRENVRALDPKSQ